MIETSLRFFHRLLGCIYASRGTSLRHVGGSVDKTVATPMRGYPQTTSLIYSPSMRFSHRPPFLSHCQHIFTLRPSSWPSQLSRFFVFELDGRPCGSTSFGKALSWQVFHGILDPLDPVQRPHSRGCFTSDQGQRDRTVVSRVPRPGHVVSRQPTMSGWNLLRRISTAVADKLPNPMQART